MASTGPSNVGGRPVKVPGHEDKIGPFPASTVKTVAGAALVVAAVVGIIKYTKKDDDVEAHAKGLKGKVERKAQEVKDSWK